MNAMMPDWNDCIACIKFRKECYGVQEQSEEYPWDGRGGGCSKWMGKLCDGCRHKTRTANGRMYAIICAAEESIHPNGQCDQYAPKTTQATLEGF